MNNFILQINNIVDVLQLQTNVFLWLLLLSSFIYAANRAARLSDSDVRESSRSTTGISLFVQLFHTPHKSLYVLIEWAEPNRQVFWGEGK